MKHYKKDQFKPYFIPKLLWGNYLGKDMKNRSVEYFAN